MADYTPIVYDYKHNVGLRCIYIGRKSENECIKKFGSKTSFKKEQ